MCDKTVGNIFIRFIVDGHQKRVMLLAFKLEPRIIKTKMRLQSLR